MKKLLAIVLITGALAACGDSGNQNRMNNSADSISNNNADSMSNRPGSPDTARTNMDMNQQQNQDSVRYNK